MIVILIRFNPVAAGLLQKALLGALSRRGLSAASEAVEELTAAAQGDVRTALNALQFTLQGYTNTSHFVNNV